MRLATRPIINPMAADAYRLVTLSVCIRTVSDLIERHFAVFADVPYQNPDSRQQWEELWESETEL
jgi:hypothetical protein